MIRRHEIPHDLPPALNAVVERFNGCDAMAHGEKASAHEIEEIRKLLHQLIVFLCWMEVRK